MLNIKLKDNHIFIKLIILKVIFMSFYFIPQYFAYIQYHLIDNLSSYLLELFCIYEDSLRLLKTLTLKNYLISFIKLELSINVTSKERSKRIKLFALINQI